MVEVGTMPRASRADPQGVARKPIPVHATPSAVLAEMDGRRREMEAWLADARRRAGPAATPELASGVAAVPPAAVPGPA